MKKNEEVVKSVLSDDWRKILSTNIRYYCKLNKIGLMEYEKECGVSKGFVSRITNNKANPSITTIATMVDEMGISLNDALNKICFEKEIKKKVKK